MSDQLAVGSDWVLEQMKRGEPIFLVEVRHAGDLDLAVMKARGALRLTEDDARKHLSEIPKERCVLVYSTAPDDQPALAVAQLLMSQGAKEVHLLVGGFKAYRSAGLPVEEIGAGSKMTRSRGL